MNLDCQRWIELTDRQAAGEALASEALEFVRQHSAVCSECSREDAVWQGFLAPSAFEAAPSDSEVEAVLANAAALASRERKVRQQRWATAGASGLAIAAAFALWLGQSPAGQHPGEQPQASAQKSGSPAIAVLTQRARAGDTATPPAASACSEAVAGIWVCSAAGSEIDRREFDSPDRVVGLARGRVVVSLKPQPAGTSFSVVTAAGRVTAVGTVFSVEAKEDGTAIARVLEGKVAVRATGASGESSLTAGESLRLGDARPASVDADERDRDLALLPLEQRARVTPSKEDVLPGSTSATVPTSDALFEQARSLRARGEFRRAADVYRRIHSSNPGSASGGAALVSLGELLLSSLGDPAGALTAFDSYLERGGPLSQEAAYGKVRALRALGRASDERRAIERFIARFPAAPQSRILRQRLLALEP